MLQKVFLIVLCVFVINIVSSPAPRILSKWPALVSLAPKCPTMPQWEELKPQLKDIALRSNVMTNLQLLDALDKKIKSCENKIEEFKAEEIEEKEESNKKENEEETENSKEDGDEEDGWIEEKDEADQDENITNTTKTKDKFKPIPSYIPIFKPKAIHHRSNAQNPKENNKLIIQYTKPSNSKPTLKVFESDSLNHDNAGGKILETVPINTGTSKTISITRESKVNTGSMNSLPLNLISNDQTYSLPTHKNPTNNNQVQTNVAVTPTVGAFNTEMSSPNAVAPVNNIIANYNPNTPMNWAAGPYFFNPAPANTANLHSIPSNLPPSQPTFHNSCSPTRSSNILPPIANSPCPKAPSNWLPYHPQPIKSLPSKVIPQHTSCSPCPNSFPHNSLPPYPMAANALPSNTVPVNPINSNAVPSCAVSTNPTCLNCFPTTTETNHVNNPCSCAPEKHNLVFFKPEDVEVIDVHGDVLKKVQLTILVPTHVSTLDM